MRAISRLTKRGNLTRPRSFAVNYAAACVDEVNKVVSYVVVAVLDEISAPEVKKLPVRTENDTCFDVGSMIGVFSKSRFQIEMKQRRTVRIG